MLSTNMHQMPTRFQERGRISYHKGHIKDFLVDLHAIDVNSDAVSMPLHQINSMSIMGIEKQILAFRGGKTRIVQLALAHNTIKTALIIGTARPLEIIPSEFSNPSSSAVSHFSARVSPTWTVPGSTDWDESALE